MVNILFYSVNWTFQIKSCFTAIVCAQSNKDGGQTKIRTPSPQKKTKKAHVIGEPATLLFLEHTPTFLTSEDKAPLPLFSSTTIFQPPVKTPIVRCGEPATADWRCVISQFWFDSLMHQ